MATTTETWAIETGNRCILKYANGTYSVSHATCFYAKVVGGETTQSPEDGSLEYSFDKTTWYTYTPIPSATVWDNGGTVYFRVRVDGKTVLSLSTVVREYADGETIAVPAYSDGETDISVGQAVALKYDHVNLSLLRTVEGETGVAAAETVAIHHTAKGTQYALSVTPGSIVKTSAGRWQNFSQVVANVSKKVGDDPWTLAGNNEVGVYYKVNDGLPSDRIPISAGVATISSAAFNPGSTEKIDVYITASEAGDPVIDMKTIAVIQMPSAGATGHAGRFYYYDGEWDPAKDYGMESTQAPYVMRHCTIDGTEKDYFFMLDFGGREVTNPTSFDDDPADAEFRGGNPWTQMSSSQQYYIAEAFFGRYAHLGSFIINEDWMISQYGTVYYSTGEMALIDSESRARLFRNEQGRDAYTFFDSDYPNSNHSGEMNFVPNFAVDGLTGKVYQNDGYFRGSGEFEGSVVVNGDNSRIKMENGVIEFFGRFPFPNIVLGLDENGCAIFQFYDKDNNLTYDLGPQGLINRSTGKSSEFVRISSMGTYNLSLPATAVNISAMANVSTSPYYLFSEGYSVNASTGVRTYLISGTSSPSSYNGNVYTSNAHSSSFVPTGTEIPQGTYVGDEMMALTKDGGGLYYRSVYNVASTGATPTLIGEFFYKKEGSRAKLTNRTGAEITVLATEPMESYMQRTMAS